MNFFEKILYFLQGEMERPKPYGWFHLTWIFLIIILITIIYLKRKNYSEKQLKIVLAIYGITAFILELIKQLIWAFNYDSVTHLVTWKYTWYAAPFQLCTTPIFVALICLFLKKCKLRNNLLSYVSYITILGSIATVLMPDSCFVRTIEVNIHTMFLHCGSLVLSAYLMINEVKPNKESLFGALKTFIVFVLIALTLNIVVYNLGILNGDTFDMFYISPYFKNSLPIFSKLEEILPYLVYLITYILIISLGGFMSYMIHKGISRKKNQ